MQSLESRLGNYIAGKWPHYRSISIKDFRDLPGGYSKFTYQFDAHAVGDGVTEVFPLILRRDPPRQTALLQNSRLLEHLLLTRLRAHTRVPVPVSHLVEMDPEVFGEPAMILERVAGLTTPTSLFRASETTAEAAQVARDLCEKLAALHTADLQVLNSDGKFSDPRGVGVVTGSWDSYMDSTLNYLIDNYKNINFDTFPVLYDAFLHMRRNKPAAMPLAMLHGELNPFNTISRDGKVAAIIDWENAHVGDPREDLAWFLLQESLVGTRFFSSVEHPGGFLGYYNELTGFNVKMEEISYFQLFAFVQATAQPFEAIKRTLASPEKEIQLVYMVLPIAASITLFTHLLGYQALAQR